MQGGKAMKEEKKEDIKESEDQKKIRTWKGKIKTEPIKYQMFEDSENESWLTDFLEKEGLSALVNILTVLVAKQTLNFAESKCLHLTAYVIKTLLVGCFSINDAEGLSTSL